MWCYQIKVLFVVAGIKLQNFKCYRPFDIILHSLHCSSAIGHSTLVLKFLIVADEIWRLRNNIIHSQSVRGWYSNVGICLPLTWVTSCELVIASAGRFEAPIPHRRDNALPSCSLLVVDLLNLLEAYMFLIANLHFFMQPEALPWELKIPKSVAENLWKISNVCCPRTFDSVTFVSVPPNIENFILRKDDCILWEKLRSRW